MYGVSIFFINQTQSGIQTANENWLIQYDIAWSLNLRSDIT